MKSISERLYEFQVYNQTLPLKDASRLKKIMAFIYRLLGRKLIGRLLISNNMCTVCKHCAIVCPNQAIRFFFKNPRRSNKCKGCLLCVYSCPNRAIELPFGSLAGAFLLLFLPFDDWIKNIFSIDFTAILGKIGDKLISFLIWCIAYVIAAVIYEKTLFLLSALPIFKKSAKIPFVKKIRREIHPASIFPVIIENDCF
ncbi:MAG: 4Fe-4S binding protein [Bacteroidota bacterium]|nr:4Fe-4S binding protein [Bacteroidota bacterium]